MSSKPPATGLGEIPQVPPLPQSVGALPAPAKSTMTALRQQLAAVAIPASCRAVGLSRAETVSRVLQHLRETAREARVA